MVRPGPVFGRRVFDLFPTLLLTVVAVLALPGSSLANTCPEVVHLKKLPITCDIPEKPNEAHFDITIKDTSFGVSATGVVLLYDNAAHTLLSDAVLFTNVKGVATVTFISDAEGVVAVPPGVPVLGKFTEGQNPISISVMLANGQSLSATICSDTESTKCSGTSDSITLGVGTSTIPEPTTFMLVATGVMGSGLVRLRSHNLRRFFRPGTRVQKRA